VLERSADLDFVVVTTAHAGPVNVASAHEIRDDLMSATLADPDGLRNRANARIRLAGDAQQDKGVRGQQGPARIGLRRHRPVALLRSSHLTTPRERRRILQHMTFVVNYGRRRQSAPLS
jgi:hypothetical protein